MPQSQSTLQPSTDSSNSSAPANGNTTTTPTDDNQVQSQSDVSANRYADYIRFKHYTALTFLFASPILIALPPRRLNNMTAVLIGAWVASSNQLLHEKTGRGILDHITSSLPSGETSLPTDRARELQTKLRESRDAQIKRYEEEKRAGDTSVSAELEKLKGRQDMDRGKLESIWMAGEKEGWKEKRIEEEQKVLSEGKGYGELIKRYFRSAWPWGKSDKGDGNDGNSSGTEGKEDGK